MRELKVNEKPPIELLLLTDPSPLLVDEYLKRGECFIAEDGQQIIGVYVLLPTSPETMELMNIAVLEALHGRGIGRKLVMNSIQTAKLRGYKTIEVGTRNPGTGQLALFRITGVGIDFFIRHYPEEIFENGIQYRDMIRLSQSL